MEAEHSKAMDAVARVYQARWDNYELRLCPLYMRQLLVIQSDAALSPQEKEEAIAALQIPA